MDIDTEHLTEMQIIEAPPPVWCLSLAEVVSINESTLTVRPVGHWDEPVFGKDGAVKVRAHVFNRDNGTLTLVTVIAIMQVDNYRSNGDGTETYDTIGCHVTIARSGDNGPVSQGSVQDIPPGAMAYYFVPNQDYYSVDEQA